jgi:nitroimidazol reductase NimA-like FMN-containing flavoprotein (pyridoxamine 5'-phosphate oxidase superfamily)
MHPAGRPHVRPVLAVWVDGALYSTSTKASRKGRNLAADPRCTVTARTDTMDVVLEGTATQVTSEDALRQVAEAYRAKYGWPVTVTNGAFDAPY